ncbi:MAG: ParA family protein [Pirellulaceae bacterium]|nr:ParA family protein [Pirellulaceae bacterium]
MPITICMINQKGGCGKSSTCFHLAGAMVEAGKRVLLMDLDPQGSLSQGFFGSTAVENVEAINTTARLFHDNAFFTTVDQLVVGTRFENISMVIANQHLARFNTPEPEETGMLQFAVREFLREAIEFDIVLIDCPPNLYRCSWTALVAADFVVIPVPPEDFGTQGLRAVHQTIEQARKLNPNLRRLGHLITRSDRRLLIHRAYEQRVREIYRGNVLETVVPEASAFKVSLAGRSPVEFDMPGSLAAKLTRQLSREILDRINEKTVSLKVA